MAILDDINEMLYLMEIHFMRIFFNPVGTKINICDMMSLGCFTLLIFHCSAKYKGF